MTQCDMWHIHTEMLGGLDQGWAWLRDGSEAEVEQVITLMQHCETQCSHDRHNAACVMVHKAEPVARCHSN